MSQRSVNRHRHRGRKKGPGGRPPKLKKWRDSPFMREMALMKKRRRY